MTNTSNTFTHVIYVQGFIDNNSTAIKLIAEETTDGKQIAMTKQ